MSLQQSIVRPPRCFLVNVSTGETMQCLFNPTQLNEKLQVNWNRLNVPGLSHQVLQYQSTGNRQLSGVEFYLDRFFAERQPGSPDILQFRGFLKSLTVPDKPFSAPPRTLLVWPKVLSVETVVTDVAFQYSHFAADGSLLVYTATVGFESVLDVRVTSEEMRRQ